VLSTDRFSFSRHSSGVYNLATLRFRFSSSDQSCKGCLTSLCCYPFSFVSRFAFLHFSSPVLRASLTFWIAMQLCWGYPGNVARGLDLQTSDSHATCVGAVWHIQSFQRSGFSLILRFYYVRLRFTVMRFHRVVISVSLQIHITHSVITGLLCMMLRTVCIANRLYSYGQIHGCPQSAGTLNHITFPRQTSRSP
jgi:hypothetical protein